MFLVWGINDWKVAPEEMRPSGTTVKSALMYTPMAQEGGSFVANLQLPADTALDYVFVITRGQNGVVTEIWDTNGKQDYHTIVGQAGVADVHGAPRKEPPPSAPGTMSYGLYALLGVGLVFGITRALRPRLKPGSSRVLASHSLRIVGLGAVLGLLLVLMRAEIMGLMQGPPKNLLTSALEILVAGYYDVVYVSLLTAVFLGLMFLLRRYQPGQRIAYLAFVVVAIISLIIGISNVKVVEVLGRPFNYQWLYYSDFLGSFDAQSGIMSNLSPAIVLSILAFCAAMLLAGQLAIEAARPMLRRGGLRRALLIGCCAGLVVYLGSASWYISRSQWSYFKLANPITSFAASVAAAGATPELFTMDLPDDLAAFPAPQDMVANSGAHPDSAGQDPQCADLRARVHAGGICRGIWLALPRHARARCLSPALAAVSQRLRPRASKQCVAGLDPKLDLSVALLPQPDAGSPRHQHPHPQLRA